MITGYGRSTRTSTVTGSVIARFRSAGQRRGAGRGLIGWGWIQHGGKPPPRRPTASPPMVVVAAAAVVEPVHDVAHHGSGIAPVGVDPHRGDLTVERDPRGHQCAELLARVAAG